MTHYYLVSYDISDEKRVRKVYKLCKNYGRPIQYSVFICHLNEENLKILKDRLKPLINMEQDQVLFAKLEGNSSGGIAKGILTSMGRNMKADPPECWIFA